MAREVGCRVPDPDHDEREKEESLPNWVYTIQTHDCAERNYDDD
jgi:hypothetical protein